MVTNDNVPMAVLKLAYRPAVESTLREILQLDAMEAQKLAAQWWDRLSKAGLMRSGVFLHDSPLKTACGLLNIKPRELSEGDHVRYQKILRASFEEAMENYQREKGRKRRLKLASAKQNREPLRMAS